MEIYCYSRDAIKEFGSYDRIVTGDAGKTQEFQRGEGYAGILWVFLFGRHVITMKIIKVINNNVVSALDKDAEEVVIMGKGIGFHAKPGQIVDEEQVEKTFRLEDQKSAGQFARLVERLPVEYLKVIRPDHHLCQEQHRAEAAPEHLSDSDRSHQFRD